MKRYIGRVRGRNGLIVDMELVRFRNGFVLPARLFDRIERERILRRNAIRLIKKRSK